MTVLRSSNNKLKERKLPWKKLRALKNLLSSENKKVRVYFTLGLFIIEMGYKLLRSPLF